MKPIPEPRSRVKAGRCESLSVKNDTLGLRPHCSNVEVLKTCPGYASVATTLDVCQLCPHHKERPHGTGE